ncbi:hypothetical protein BGY98DRAFT_935968 [Russula aff. rugulosa BPL654]|nr:hypothetical protein BGY98DRAFT_935968 [Russula aff. rugulosa BPL654]
MASSGVVHDCMIHGCHCHASGVDTTNSSYRSITKIPNHKLARDTLFSKVSIPRDKHPHGRLFIENDLEELADAYEKELIREFGQKDWARLPVLFDPSYSVVSVTMATRPRSSRAMSSYWKATARWRTLASRIRPSHLPVE